MQDAMLAEMRRYQAVGSDGSRLSRNINDTIVDREFWSSEQEARLMHAAVMLRSTPAGSAAHVPNSQQTASLQRANRPGRPGCGLCAKLAPWGCLVADFFGEAVWLLIPCLRCLKSCPAASGSAHTPLTRQPRRTRRCLRRPPQSRAPVSPTQQAPQVGLTPGLPSRRTLQTHGRSWARPCWAPKTMSPRSAPPASPTAGPRSRAMREKPAQPPQRPQRPRRCHLPAVLKRRRL
jgi:hypothetical protein